MRVNQDKARDGTRELMDGVAFVSSSLGGNFFFVVIDGGLDLLVWLGSVGSLWWHALLLFYWCTPHVIRYDTVCSRVSLCIVLRYCSRALDGHRSFIHDVCRSIGGFTKDTKNERGMVYGTISGVNDDSICFPIKGRVKSVAQRSPRFNKENDKNTQ